MPTPEDKAREKIDQALDKAGWKVEDTRSANVSGGRGVALRNFSLSSGHGFADYLLYIDGKAAGVIEAKKEGFPLTGVEIQAEKYSKGLPPSLPAHRRPLPFLYQSTGIETRFTNGLDPEPRSRSVFSFHRPEFLAAMIPEQSEAPMNLHGASLAAETATTLRAALRTLPPLENQFEPGSTFFHRAMKIPHSSSGSLVVPFCVECTCKKMSGAPVFQG